MRKYLLLILVPLFLFCEKEPVRPVIIHPHTNSQLNFAGFTTNQDEEILHSISHHSKMYVNSDTLADKIIHRYMEQNKLLKFYNDTQGSLFNQVHYDLAAQSINFGFPYQGEVVFSFWRPEFLANQKSWDFSADTTFSLSDSVQQMHQLYFSYSGIAHHMGSFDIFVPENHENSYHALAVEWNPFETLLLDQTTQDTLFYQKGILRHFFEPNLGLIRVLSDYNLSQSGKKNQFLKSTWELLSVDVPVPVYR